MHISEKPHQSDSVAACRECCVSIVTVPVSRRPTKSTLGDKQNCTSSFVSQKTDSSAKATKRKNSPFSEDVRALCKCHNPLQPISNRQKHNIPLIGSLGC